QWRRHSAGAARKSLRALLYDKAAGKRRRPDPGASDHDGAWRNDRTVRDRRRRNDRDLAVLTRGIDTYLPARISRVHSPGLVAKYAVRQPLGPRVRVGNVERQRSGVGVQLHRVLLEDARLIEIVGR